MKKQNSTLDGNPAITVSYTFAHDDTVFQPSLLEKQLAEVTGKTLTVEKDIDDIEVYKKIQTITIKNGVSYIVR
jgi:hypothetical protein